MKIPEEFKKYILSELDFVIQKLKDEENPRRKLYYFSASYATLERLMRYSLDPQLLLTHAVLHLCYNTLFNRLNSIMQGDTTIEMPEDYDKKLVEYLVELKNKIAKDEDTYRTLEKFVHLAYQTTGAGYYTKNYLKAIGKEK
ncbi:hypothetical protein DRO19_03605 [Candidatus Bathyarchaeota archaeon]|nr:MAG: hypothetical protein DRO19_03605 [Candidatus Bathyarchaeota archaeon]